MKSFMEVLADKSPKNEEKLAKAFEKGGSSQSMAAFIAESERSSAREFPKAKCMVTDSFLCSYAEYGLLSHRVYVIPLEIIKRVYRTNIDQDSKYDLDRFYLCVEVSDGRRILIASADRDRQSGYTCYNETVAYVRSRLN